MKINGKEINKAYLAPVVFPRPGSDNIVFMVQAVLDFDECDKLNPRPQAPWVRRPGKAPFQDVTNRDYKKNLNDWAEKQTSWIILKALEATPGLEWSTVKMNDPDTWGNFKQELIDAKLSPAEIGKLINECIVACGLDEKKIQEATDSFLAQAQETLEKQSSQNTEQNDMQSGELVNG